MSRHDRPDAGREDSNGGESATTGTGTDGTPPVPDGGAEPDTVVVTSDQLGSGTPPPERRIGGVLLAAGKGERYDGPFKLLESVDGVPIVRKAANAMVASDLEEVVVIVGHEAESVRAVLDGLDVDVLENERYAEGQSTSVHLGVEVAREREWDAVVFGLGDMPLVTGDAVDMVRRAYLEGFGSIVSAGYEGKRGNPTLFDARYYDDLEAVSGDTGGRPVLLSSSDVAVIETAEPGVLQDVDTREDFETLE